MTITGKVDTSDGGSVCSENCRLPFPTGTEGDDHTISVLVQRLNTRW